MSEQTISEDYVSVFKELAGEGELTSDSIQLLSEGTCDGFSLLMTENCLVAQDLGGEECLTKETAEFSP